MKSALWPLQQALFACLKADTALTSKVKGVFDEVSANQAYPYVTLGEDTVVDWSTKTNDGEEITHTFHVWSKYAGKKEAKEILSLVLEAVTRQPLVLSSGFSIDFSGLDFMEVFIDEDGTTKHGVLRIRFKILQ
ncbi:DUF3168 domain-containing protein [Brevibacillus choshinensis]|uniref:DUF3168 domain-containing protein n=1 Tax=Brevibacillus choshinensis TaxID=54911 RepID=UPI002E1E9163|nr:DUF3168 domain-containing protein [Brevibacillus choshinensis]